MRKRYQQRIAVRIPDTFETEREISMSGQQKKKEQLKQQLLDQIQTQQEAIEALSEEELESVAGGVMGNIANVNTGAVVPHYTVGNIANVNTGAVVPHVNAHVEHNVNAGAVMPNR